MKYKLTDDQILHVINKVGEDVIIDIPETWAFDGEAWIRETTVSLMEEITRAGSMVGHWVPAKFEKVLRERLPLARRRS